MNPMLFAPCIFIGFAAVCSHAQPAFFMGLGDLAVLAAAGLMTRRRSR